MKMIRKGEDNQQSDNEPAVMQANGNASDASDLDVCPHKCGNSFRSLASDYSSLVFTVSQKLSQG
jgi:hypothetical protein